MRNLWIRFNMKEIIILICKSNKKFLIKFVKFLTFWSLTSKKICIITYMFLLNLLILLLLLFILSIFLCLKPLWHNAFSIVLILLWVILWIRSFIIIQFINKLFVLVVMFFLWILCQYSLYFLLFIWVLCFRLIAISFYIFFS
jgi:hypothetical protein